MTRRVIASSLLCLIFAAQGARYKRQQTKTSIAGVPVRNYRSGATDWVVSFQKGVTDASLSKICKGRCKIVGHPDEGGVAFAKVSGGEKTLEELIREQPEVVEVLEPDEMQYEIPEVEVEASAEVVNPWSLERIGAKSRKFTGKGVNIYVQDTGVKYVHTDFEGRAIASLELTKDVIDECEGRWGCGVDYRGHGTHVAGTAGSKSCGVASESNIWGIKSLNDQGRGLLSWQISAVDWVTANAKFPAIHSMSLGGSRSESTLYETAIGAATAKGITVVVAAGNSNDDTCNYQPAYVSAAITVGATDYWNRRSSYSNHGVCNNIYAPGTQIASLDYLNIFGFIDMSGTSMACPAVSGAAALLLEENPSLTPNDIMASLEAGASRGLISGLQKGDPDTFLWVGSGPAP